MARQSRYLPIDPGSIERLWILRALVKLPSPNEFIQKNCFSDDAKAEMIGLGRWVGIPFEKFDPTRVRADMLELLHEAERRAIEETEPPTRLYRNIERLAALTGLSGADRLILEFAVLLRGEPMLHDVVGHLGEMSTARAFRGIGEILGLSELQVRVSLNTRGLLFRSGLLSVEDNNTYELHDRLTPLSDDFADRMISSDVDPADLLRDTVRLAPAAELNVDDYRHVGKSLAILRPYLRHASVAGRPGVNILLHGAPGTGKSQLARVLAADLGCKLFEVASEGPDDEPIDSQARLRAFRAAQILFGQRLALIVFDEIEDVFDDAGSMFSRRYGGGGMAQKRKAWMNRTLEENPVPTLWIANSIQGMDPAFIRRFDMVVELPVPPRRQRRRIIEQVCRDVLCEAGMARLAGVETLTPAVLARAAAVVRTIGSGLDAAQKQDALENLVSSTLTAQGHEGLRRHDPDRLSELYDPAFINADVDPSRLATGLRRVRAARLCLFGPPGTGKTAYGRWLAERLDAPLLIRRASDLLSMWVGGTEKNLRDAFREAEQEGAVLLIDEVDSFLQDRRKARQGWEITEVNEMLTQMESFPGVFIASTNLMDGLDQAALRRFDLKIRFDYLRGEQAWKLLHRHCAALDLPHPGGELRDTVEQLNRLTPGDFTTVARQHRFHPVASPAGFVAALQSESEVKEGTKPAVGFLH